MTSANNQQFSFTMDHLLEGCQIIGFDWTYLYLNKSAEIHNRRSNAELIGRKYQDMWPGVEQTEVFKLIKNTLEQRTSSHFENEFIFPDGSKGWFDLSIEPIPEGVFILSVDITDKKKTELILKENEEKYRILADHSVDLIYWYSPDGKINYISPSCEKITGYPDNEFMDDPKLLAAIIHPADKELYINHALEIGQNQFDHSFNFRIIKKDGEIRWLNHTCQPMFNETGEFIGRRSKNHDITELRLKEEKLNESEIRFNKLYFESPFGMALVGSDFRFKAANPSFLAMLGYSETELLEKTFTEITHPDDRKKGISDVLKLIHNEVPVIRLEKRYIRKNGAVMWATLTIVANYDSDGNFINNLAIVEDITVRKQAEEELRQRAAQLNQAQEIGKMGSWSINMKAGTLSWSENMYRLLGMEPFSVEPTFELYLTLVHPDDRHLQDTYLLQIMQTKQELNYDSRYRLPSGEIIWVQNNISPVFENDILIELYGTNIDITEKKKIEQELIRAKEHAEASDRLKSEFLNNISHEIRTPLNGILGFASLTTDQNISPANREMYSNLLNKSSDRLIKTITDIIDLSMIISGSQTIQKEHFDVISLLNQVTAEFAKEFERKKLLFVSDNQTGYSSLEVYTDSTLLHKVLSQLVDNAVKFTDNGEIRLACRIEHQEIIFELKDTGVGIAENIRKQVFGFFMQEDSSNTRRFEGSGNGLSIANGFVQLLGGKIWFDSEAGKGSTFFVSFPVDSH